MMLSFVKDLFELKHNFSTNREAKNKSEFLNSSRSPISFKNYSTLDNILQYFPDEKTSHEKLASEAGDDYAEDSSLYDYSQNYYSVSPSKELKNHENKNFTIAKGKKLKDFIKEE